MSHRAALLANALLLGLALAWLTFLLLPTARTVRARNAWLLRRGADADFDWDPDRLPPGFRTEARRAPEPIVRAVSDAGIPDIAGDWPRARALTSLLVRHARSEGGIRADLATTWKGIVDGHGYCSDYVRVFLAAAGGVGLFCRQWAFSFDGFGGHGHTFVEVYDRARGRWAFLDVHNNVYAVREGDDAPLDARTLRAMLLAGGDGIEFRRAGEGRLGYPDFGKLLDYYRRGAGEWYLWWGNDVVTRDRSALAGALSHVSSRLAHRVGSGLVSQPPLVAWATPDNEAAIRRMERLRGQLRLALAAVAGLAAALAWQALAVPGRTGRA